MNQFIPIASPCVSVCMLDDERGHCRGCARTLDEIAAWSRYSHAERTHIMQALPARLAALAHENTADY